MRRLLGPFLLATLTPFLVVGCGGGGDPRAAPASDAPPAPYRVVKLVSGTGGGGRVAKVATLVNSKSALDAYLRQFRSDGLRNQVRTAVQGVTAGPVWLQVVTIGCDVPPGAAAAVNDNTVSVTPEEVASPLPECLAPVTTVALAAPG